MTDLLKFVPEEVKTADRLYFSHSGGKDSQAALALLIRMGLKNKITIIHSDLKEMEWEPMHNWIESISFGLPVNVTTSDKFDFFSLMRHYKRLPSGHAQFCTDFLKTQPIKDWIHADMIKNGYKTSVNVTGMRAAESKKRAAKKPFTLSKGDGTSGMHMPVKYKGHTVYDWMPIHAYSTEEVFEEIKLAGQVPHGLYSQGFSRLSCVFCIFGRVEEQKKAAKMRPELYKKVVQLEVDLGKTYRTKQRKGKKLPKYLTEFCGEVA